MALTPGTRLGVYEIAALLGAGGMGEVYRARDTKLGRDVAIKVLSDGFTHDAERITTRLVGTAVGSALPPALIMRNRLPSGAMSYVRPVWLAAAP